MPLLVVLCLAVGFAVGIVSVVVHPPSVSAAQYGQNRVVNASATATITPNTGRTTPPDQPSPFVRLSLLLLNDSLTFSSFDDFDGKVFSSNRIDRSLVSKDFHWAVEDQDTDRPYALFSNAHNRTSNGGDTRPLRIASELRQPFLERFGMQDFSPGGMGDPFETWAQESLARASNQAVSPGKNDQEGLFSAGSNRPPLGYQYALDKKTSINAGLTWVQDLNDTTGMALDLEEPGSDPAKASGVHMSLGGRYKAISLTGGYIRVVDPRSPMEFTLDSKASDPVAWNSELAYSTELLKRETTLAIGYLKSSDALNVLLPEERYSTKASMALSGSTTFSLEYYQDRENAVGKSEENGYGITTRIGFDF